MSIETNTATCVFAGNSTSSSSTNSSRLRSTTSFLRSCTVSSSARVSAGGSPDSGGAWVVPSVGSDSSVPAGASLTDASAGGVAVSAGAAVASGGVAAGCGSCALSGAARIAIAKQMVIQVAERVKRWVCIKLLFNSFVQEGAQLAHVEGLVACPEFAVRGAQDAGAIHEHHHRHA